MNQLPPEILNIKQWSYSHSVAELKRPRHSHYTPNGSMTFAKAKQAAGNHLHVGFYVTDEDPYILGDVDHVPNPTDAKSVANILPMELADILLNHQVYSEISPSGEGIRFIAKLPQGAKAKLTGRYFKSRIKLEEPLDAQMGIGAPWNTITGNRTPYSSDKIVELTLEQLDDVFKLKYLGEEVSASGHQPPPEDADGQLPLISGIRKAVEVLDFSQNPRTKRAFKQVFNEEYTNYEYWLKVLMAVSDYASKTPNAADKNEALDMMLTWSTLDEEGFTGETDVINKWRSFQKTGTGKVTYHTLLALAHYNTLRWPVQKALTMAQMKAGLLPNQPLVSEFANFRAMVDFYDLKLYRDVNASHKMYLTGDQDIIDQYFKHIDVTPYFDKYYGAWVEKSLIAKFHIMCQDHGFIGMTHPQVKQDVADWISDISREVDMVRLYFDTPYDKLPQGYKEDARYFDISTPEYLFGCLTLDHLTDDHVKEEKLYFRYYKAWLMGLARNVFFPDSKHMNNCVLLLTGKEQIRKTSHFKCILPKFMREERVADPGHGFSTENQVRDITKIASQNNLVYWDEVERFLNQETESNFKKLIDNNPIKMIDKYEVLPSYIKPIAIYGATSNQSKFKLSDTGSRRIFHIPITWCDTDLMERINWWRIVNDLRYEIENSDDPPWLLTEEELEYQATLHGRITAQTSLDMILEEIFDFTEPSPVLAGPLNNEAPWEWNNDPAILSMAQISTMINQHMRGPQNFSRPVLKNTLERLCGRWTGSARKQFGFKQPKSRLHKGAVHYNNKYRFWVPTSKLGEEFLE